MNKKDLEFYQIVIKFHDYKNNNSLQNIKHYYVNMHKL